MYKINETVTGRYSTLDGKEGFRRPEEIFCSSRKDIARTVCDDVLAQPGSIVHRCSYQASSTCRQSNRFRPVSYIFLSQTENNLALTLIEEITAYCCLSGFRKFSLISSSITQPPCRGQGQM